MGKIKKVIKNLTEDLHTYDKILLVLADEASDENLITAFWKSKALQNAAENILILSKEEAPDMEHCRFHYRRITAEESDCIRQLYMMYEFSDQIRILSNHVQYGSLLNYIKTGILTREEAFQAFLES